MVKDVTIPKMWEYYNGNGNSHWNKFRIAAGLDAGEWSGTNWHDGDLYKWIEAVAHVYMVTGDAALDRQMDEAIEVKLCEIIRVEPSCECGRWRTGPAK